MKTELNRNSSPRGLWSSLALVAFVVLILLPSPALAYLDPGTGSFVIQGIIAAVVGAGIAVKMFWHRIKSALTGKSIDDDDDADE